MHCDNEKIILLVEDEDITARVQKNSLEKYMYKVITANSGEKAIEEFKINKDIDLVLMDIDLGDGMDGTETAIQILEEREFPLMFLSSHTEPEVVAKTEKITNYGYVVKNSGITILDASIKMAFKLFTTKREIWESEIKQKAMIANSSDVIIILDKNSILKYSSPNITRCFGWQPVDLLETTSFSRIHPDDLERIRKEFFTLLENDNSIFAVELRYQCKDGNYKQISLTATNLLNDPIIKGVLLNFHDITKRKSMEEEIKTKNKELAIQNEEKEKRAAELIVANHELAFQNQEKEKRAAELIIINNKLAAMIKEIEMANENLLSSSKSCDFAESIIETLREPLLVMDSNLKILTANQAFYDFFKVKPEETLGNLIYDIGNKQWNIPKLRILLEEILPRNTVLNGYKVQHDFPNIGQKTILLNAQQIFQKNIGSNIILLAMEDITEKKIADDRIKIIVENKLFLREVHHRVKNYMNTIAGILYLHEDSLKDPLSIAALQDAEGRILNMMVLYDKLYCNDNLNNISIMDYLPSLVDEIVANFPNSKSVRVETKIDDFVLNAKKIQPLGIIINELITNIMKHAFIGRDQGEITVFANLTGINVTIIIQDNGIGLPESITFQNAEGFGMQLVSTLAEQIDASIKIKRGAGTKFVLEFEL